MPPWWMATWFPDRCDKCGARCRDGYSVWAWKEFWRVQNEREGYQEELAAEQQDKPGQLAEPQHKDAASAMDAETQEQQKQQGSDAREQPDDVAPLVVVVVDERCDQSEQGEKRDSESDSDARMTPLTKKSRTS